MLLRHRRSWSIGLDWIGFEISMVFAFFLFPILGAYHLISRCVWRETTACVSNLGDDDEDCF